MRLISAGATDVGLQREHNEDSFCIVEAHRLFVVADGMGGHRAGDVASRMATTELANFFANTERQDATWPFHYDPKLTIEENRLVSGIKLANKKIFDASCQSRDVNGMGTTIVGLVYGAEQNRFYIAHVGDSRAYLVRDAKITPMTRDHSLVNDYLMFMPELSPEQRQELPRNVITRALGMQDVVSVDLATEPLKEGDCYVLCSDGLSSMVTDDEIREVVVAAGQDVDRAARELIEIANAKGGEDNVTVVVVMASA